VYRGSEIDSDHFILESKFEIPQKRQRHRNKRKQKTSLDKERLETQLLEQESIRYLYGKRLKEKLKPVTQDVEDDWQNIKGAVLTAAKERLGTNQ
jgi:NAD(P)H-flavin reductase